MPVTVLTDEELNRALSLYVSTNTPLPPEIALNGSYKEYFDFIIPLSLFGFADHPVVVAVSDLKIKEGQAKAIEDKAPYLDRIAHLNTVSSAGVFTDLHETPTDRPTMSAIPCQAVEGCPSTAGHPDRRQTEQGDTVAGHGVDEARLTLSKTAERSRDEMNV